MRKTALALAGMLWCSLALAAPQVESDVVYGHRAGMALTYDVFRPGEPNGAGIVYMVSGGWFSFWRSHDRMGDHFGPLLDEGFTVFAVRHGSAAWFKVPDAVSDVRAAVRHIKANATTYGVDSDRLGVRGGSAGGHLSLMLSLNPEGKPTPADDEGYRRRGPVYLAGQDDPARLKVST